MAAEEEEVQLGDRKGTGGEGAEGRALRPDPCLTVCPEAAARGRPRRC